MDDKPKNRISITFNGKEQNINMKDREEKKTEKKEEEFPWVLPKENENIKSSYSPEFNPTEKNRTSPFQFQHRKKRKRNVKGVKRNFRFKLSGLWVPFLSAICIGIVLGTVVLSLFTDALFINTVKKDSSIMGMANIPDISDSDPQLGGGNIEPTINASPVDGGIDEGVELKSLSVYVVQAGVFSNMEAATTELNKMKQLGYPGEIIESDQIMLFIGMGTSMEETKQLGELYTKREEEVYVKEYTVEGSHFENGRAGKYIAKGLELYEMLLNQSVITLKGSAVSSQELSDMKLTMEEWEALKPENSNLNDTIVNFADNIETAFELIQSPQVSSNQSVKWDIQQNLLSGLPLYEKLQK